MDRKHAPQAREQRAAARFETRLPVHLDGAAASTCDISAQGICFEADEPLPLGALVNFSVEYSLYGQRHRLSCEGKVVRVDREDGRTRVAARLLAPFFEGEEPVTPAVPRTR